MLLAQLKTKTDSLDRKRQRLFFQINRLNENFCQYRRNTENHPKIDECELPMQKSQKISHQKKLKARILEILQQSEDSKRFIASTKKYSYQQERHHNKTPSLQRTPTKHRFKFSQDKGQSFLSNVRSLCEVNLIRSSSNTQKPKYNKIIKSIETNIFKKESNSSKKIKLVQLPNIRKCVTEKSQKTLLDRQNNFGPWKNQKQEQLLILNDIAF